MAYNIYSYDETQARYKNVSWETISSSYDRDGYNMIVKEININDTISHLTYLHKGNGYNIDIKNIRGPIINDAYILDKLRTNNCHITYTVTDRLTVDDLEELGYDQLLEDNRMGYTSPMCTYKWPAKDFKEVISKQGIDATIEVPISNRFSINVCGESAYIAFNDEGIVHVSGTTLLMKHSILMHDEAPFSAKVHLLCVKDEELIKLLETFGHINEGLKDV